LLVWPQIESFEMLSSFVDLFHYLHYKIRKRRKLDVSQLQGFTLVQPNLREEFTYYFQVSNESNFKNNDASNLNTVGARIEYRSRNRITYFLNGFLHRI
jgi:hypothetical protein